VAPLVPVSQVLVPLQNVMADRYLCVAVAAPCALLGLLCGHLEARRALAGRLLGAALCLAFGALSAQRARVFSDSVRLWEDALETTPGSALALLQLGHARRSVGDLRGAEAAWTALWRQPEDPAARCNGAGNLSRILAADGRDLEAIGLLRGAVALCPWDPKALNNLAELLARRGVEPEARARFDELVRRFPAYAPGRRNRARRYGP
jgi:tetratricopeptide (TPR) repeat protein